MPSSPGRRVAPWVPPAANQSISPFSTVNLTNSPPRTPPRSYSTDPLPFPFVNQQRVAQNARTFIATQTESTPNGPSLGKPSFDLDIQEQHTQLKEELASSIIELPAPFAASLYHHWATDEAIEAFLEEIDVYDTNVDRWDLPESDKNLKEIKVYPRLIKVLTAILGCFMKKATEQGTRKIIDTHLTKIYHKEAIETDRDSRPDISVKAEGLSFELPFRETKEDIGYSNMASFFEVKVENSRQAFTKELAQVAAYVRQIFIQQPNRRFVRALLITEQRFRLFHFDRSGVLHTEQMDLHSKETRHIFIRLVLGLSSSDESELGLDVSIQWKIEEGRKVGGTLKTGSKPGGAEISYKLASVEPIWAPFNSQGPCILGPCATYWSVVDPQSGRKLLVKDAWRSEERVSEKTYLEKARGVPGVIQMISCEENRGETRELGGFEGFIDTPPSFNNRISIRIVMDNEGRLIKDFTSPMEVVLALRDAIAAHQRLYEKNILHRDISIYNIALGKPTAEPGSVGVLLGLDMAIFNDSPRTVPASSENGRTGDRTYWSITILSRGDPTRKPYNGPHDHLDDLEAFLYVLIHLTHSHDSQGKELPIPRQIEQWILESAWKAADAKQGFLGNLNLSPQVVESWPKSCHTLLVDLMEYLGCISKSKLKLATQRPEVRQKKRDKMMKAVNAHYATVIQYFEKAVRALNEEAKGVPEAQTPTSYYSSSESDSFSGAPSSPDALYTLDTPPRPPRTQGTISRLLDLQGDQVPRKRALEEDPDGQPEAKRAGHDEPKTPPRRRAKVRVQGQVVVSSPLSRSEVLYGKQD